MVPYPILSKVSSANMVCNRRLYNRCCHHYCNASSYPTPAEMLLHIRNTYSYLPPAQMVLHNSALHLRPIPGLLQCIWVWADGLVFCIHLREACHLCYRGLGGCFSWRNSRWFSSMWYHDEHRHHCLRPHAGFQDGLLDYVSSPCSLFVSQAIGTAMGCVISPCVFWVFYKAIPDLGLPTSDYPAPYATIYYNIANIGVEGASALPYYCMKLCYEFLAAAILINIIRDVLGKKKSWFIPLPTATPILFYVGAYFASDMCIGSLVLYIWQKINKAKADAFGTAIASGLICGEGMWTLPSSVLALAGVKSPICMKFLSRETNSKVENFLRS